MPNTSNDDVIIVGSLSDKELRDSIDGLVNYVGNQTTIMAGKFDVAMEKMKSAMKDFAITQKVSVDLMQDAWKQMSASFDAMLKAQQNATSSGNNSGAAGKPSGTSITELRNNISVVEQEIQAVEKKTAAWRASRNEIILMKNALRDYRADVKSYEYRQNKGEVLSKADLMLYEDAKKKVERFTSELKELWAKRGNIPAPSKEDLQKYDELQRKLAELKKSLDNAMTPDTVGDLEKQISTEERYRKKMELGTQELRDQNQLIAEQKKQLKEELMTEEEKRKAIEKQNEALERQKAKQLKNAQSPYLYNFNKANTESSKDIASAEQKLRNLKKAVDDMRKSGLFDEVKLNKAQKAIDSLEQKIERMRSRKPMTLNEVVGMDESSVDAIAKKMQALKRVSIDPTNTAQVKQLGDEYQRLKRLQAELMGQNIQATHSNNYLAQSFGYIRNRLVYAMTLGAITSFTKQVYEIRGQYELLERSLGVLVNSFERGSQIFQELNQMAIESPFTLMELAGAAKQLTAYNFAANEVVDTTRRLADISAALGVPMERLTYNLGQIRAQTVLTARDARDFANAGLPIVASLAEHFTELEGKIVTTGDVYDRMSKKMVSYSDVMSVLNKMTDEGGKFFEFQAKQAETLRVQMANLNLAWNNMLNDIGKSNQGLLTLPISGLKALLQNWQTIDRVLKSMLYTFIGWKALQMVAIRQQWAWATATGATAKQMGFLANSAKGLFASMKALFLNPWTWVFVGIMAVVDLVRQTNAAREAMHELNQEIRDNANEASESMLNYLNNKGNQSTRQLAQQNKLTAEQGERAWESLKGQIEQSAISANGLISELLTIDDINERVRVGFDYAERIQKAQAALQDLKDDSIEVNTDVGWFGMLGEGLVSDLKDYADYIEKYSEIARNSQMAGDVASEWMHQVGVVKGARQEFLEELDDTAESINNFIRAYNITDPLQINEILERVRSQIKAKNPEIKGEVAKIFDISLDQKMAELTNGAVDRNASLWNMFMERLKHNSSSAFQDINDDWIKNNEALSSEQQAAVDANLQYFKDSMPYAYQAVSEMVADASKLKIHIGIAFNVQQLSDFQKEVKQRIGSGAGVLDFGGGAFLPTNNDNLSSWVKTQQQAIKSLGEENKKYALDDTQWSKEKIAANDREIQQRKNLLDLFHQQYAEEKKVSKGGNRKGGNRKHEDVVAEALKQELQLIREMQSNYDKLRKSGVSNMDAIDLASKGYEATIIRINQVLSKFGIDKFNAANFAGKDVRSLLQSLEEQRQALLASGKVKTSSLQALDVEIQKLTVDAKTYDMKKVTDGLNSELGKIKDEYELAIELDANPELGDMFADMFGINTSTLPKTFGDALDRAQTIINRKLKELNITTPFDLMEGNIDSFAKSAGVDKDSALIKELVSAQKSYRDMFKKNITETEKVLDDYVKKYGDYSDKIAEIEASRLEKIKKLNEAYYTDAMRNSPEYKRKRQAIDTAAVQEKSQAQWDNFTNTRLYVELFENLELASTGALRAMKEKLDEVKGSMNNLKPEQLKQITAQYMKLEKELMSRNPFKGAIKHAKDYMKAVGKTGKQAQKDFITAQRNYDAQEKVVATLKEQYEQKKAQEPTNTKAIEALAQQLGLEEDKLAKLKEILNAADQEAQKYNMMTKLFKEQANEIAALLQAIGQNLQSLADLRDNLQSTFGFEFSDSINGAIDGLARMGKGISGSVSSAQSGDVFGILNGVVDVFAGIGDGIASLFGDGSARTKRLNREINESRETVRQLSMAYDDLERAIDKSLGTGETEARRLAIANKEAQLAELERQKELEQSKRSKDRDDDAIKQYEESIHSLRNEIDDLKQDVVNNLWGEDVKSAAEAFVDAWVQSWRAGETTLDAIQEKMDEMIYNLIKKAMTSKIVETLLNPIYKELDRMTKEGSEGGVALTTNEIRQLAQQAGITAGEINTALGEFYGNLEQLGIVSKTEDKSSELSALQQGIQGVTEDTAGAIEAYMNIVAQRVFEQNLYLQEIRDHLNNFDLDVQLGTLSQMLLQLQQSYQVQQNIESILTGVLNPSGRAIVVELNS